MSVTEIGSEFFARLGEPVFLVREDGADASRTLTVHTMDRRRSGHLSARIAAALRSEGSTARCRVVVHNPNALRRARSLEALSRRFAGGRVAYDPTGFVSRSEAVASCARRLRDALGGDVRNIYLDATRRTLYVILASEVSPARRAELVRQAGDVMAAWQQGVDRGLALAVRIGATAPQGVSLVSVDSASVTQTIRASLLSGRSAARRIFAMGAAVLLGGSLTVPASADPAVSALNGTLVVRGGAYDFNATSPDQDAGDLLGKISIPVAGSIGAQVEGGVGTDEYYTTGGHLFWRDPGMAMAGAFVSYDNFNQFELLRYGVEADVYLGKFTLGGRVGHQSGDYGEGTYGSVDVSYYVTPNLALRGGAEFEPEDGRDTTGRVGFEWQPAVDASPGLSVFADGEWGDDYNHVRAGLKIHFGVDGMSMIDRERKADPDFVTGNKRSPEPYGSVGYAPAPAPAPAPS